MASVVVAKHLTPLIDPYVYSSMHIYEDKEREREREKTVKPVKRGRKRGDIRTFRGQNIVQIVIYLSEANQDTLMREGGATRRVTLFSD